MTSSLPTGHLPPLVVIDEALADRVDDLRRSCARAAQPPLSNVAWPLAGALRAAADSPSPDVAAQHLAEVAQQAAVILELRSLRELRPINNPATARAVTEQQRAAAMREDEERAVAEAEARAERFRAEVAAGRDLDDVTARHAAAAGLTWPVPGSGTIGEVQAAEVACGLLRALWAPTAGPLGAAVTTVATATAEARRVLDLAEQARRRDGYVPVPLGASR
jgi:hypothetical protein